MGFRLGATLAMLAASPREDVAGLVLLDPVVDGTSYLEELRGWHDAMLRHSNVMRGVADPAGEGEMEEILGFAYPRTLIASLEHFNLAARDASFARNMLLIETHEERDPFGFPARSRPSSPNFEYKHLPHPELWERTDRFQIEDVNRVQIPRQLLRSVVTWTSERCA